LLSDKEEPEDNFENIQNSICNVDNNRENFEEDTKNDILVDGTLLYRYSINQIELDGFWHISNFSTNKERLSYLFNKSNQNKVIELSPDEIEFSGNSDHPLNQGHGSKFKLNICSANLYELLLINNKTIFDKILEYLSDEYSGYFLYYGKTIEDRLELRFSLQDSLVKIDGNGGNTLGNFMITGYMNFYQTKGNIFLTKRSFD